MTLDDADLAYMRETQAQFRPTSAEVVRGGRTPDGRGGFTETGGTPEPLDVRIVSPNDSTSSDDVPRDLAGRYGATNLWKIVTDLVPLNEGDRLHDLERNRWYRIVSTGITQEWTTAQAVWATPEGA